jgi:hypothetical protein
MSSVGSVSPWIDQLRAGDRAAAPPLWHNYFQRLVALARQKLCRRVSTATADEEDMALSAFDSFIRAAEQGRVPQLNDRDDLWRLLLVITERKAIDLLNHERRVKRGGGKVRYLSALADDVATISYQAGQIMAPEPTPKMAAQLADE